MYKHCYKMKTLLKIDNYDQKPIVINYSKKVNYYFFIKKKIN